MATLLKDSTAISLTQLDSAASGRGRVLELELDNLLETVPDAAVVIITVESGQFWGSRE